MSDPKRKVKLMNANDIIWQDENGFWIKKSELDAMEKFHEEQMKKAFHGVDVKKLSVSASKCDKKS